MVVADAERPLRRVQVTRGGVAVAEVGEHRPGRRLLPGDAPQSIGMTIGGREQAGGIVAIARVPKLMSWALRAGATEEHSDGGYAYRRQHLDRA